VLLGAAGGFVLYSLLNDDKADNCGIVGFVGEEPAVNYLLEGLIILQNRGYDSAGIVTINGKDHDLKITKHASLGTTSDSIELVKKNAPNTHGNDNIGVAHTRWATHGGKTDANAHPHMDYKSRVALVHNGTIENSHALKSELQARGIPFKSETDTEVIVQLIGSHLDEGMDIMEAVRKTLSRLEGTWGLAIVHKDTPGQIIAARNGSPLVVGIGKGRMFVASEVSAFNRHTNQFIALNDGEVAVVKADGVSLDLARIEKAHQEHIQLSPEPFPHWTIKEIMEQPEALSRTLAFGARFSPDGKSVKLGGLEANKSVLMGIKHLMIAACGTSYFAGMYGARLMRSLRAFDTVTTMDASEVSPEFFPHKKGGLLVISQSGETKDTHRSVVQAQEAMVPRFSVINQVGSMIARATNCGVYINAGREHAVASTKAFTTQVTALALIAAWFSQNRVLDSEGFVSADALVSAEHQARSQKTVELIESIQRLPIYCGMSLRTHDKCRDIAQRLKDQQHMFILGKGYAEPIAYEGALKVKEISYIHAEGYSGGALKHGPFALLDEGVPVVMLVLNDQHAELMRIAAAEVRARGAHTIIITDKQELAKGIANEEDVVVIPSNGPMTALLGVIPLQLIAYELSLLKGNDPDKPRHLAKAVTVD